MFYLKINSEKSELDIVDSVHTWELVSVVRQQIHFQKSAILYNKLEFEFLSCKQNHAVVQFLFSHRVSYRRFLNVHRSWT